MAWLQLVRVPNLFTVPGDPLAGMFLAVDADLGTLPAGRTAAVAAASLLLYAAGLIWNDVADVEEDRRDRPSRPLPRGLIAVRSAAIVAVVLAVAGVAMAAWVGARTGTVAAVLAATVVVYNIRAKHSAWLGPLTMALCRALSLLMGVALAVDTVGTPRGMPFVAASALFVYIALVSIVAREEMSSAKAGWERQLPAGGMACGFLSLLVLFVGWGHGVDGFALALGGAAAGGALAVCAAATADRAPGRLPQTVGLWILCLIPMQAAWCLWSGHAGGLWIGAVLLLAWPLALFTSKRFYAS
jgi:4-hydroxybenzoate polyprenyltransferase